MNVADVDQVRERVVEVARDVMGARSAAIETEPAGDVDGVDAGVLALPIRLGDQTMGDLVLRPATGRQFSSEDEDFGSVFAAIVAVALNRARLESQAARERRWHSAETATTQELFEVTESDPLGVVLRGAIRGAEGDFALLALRLDERLVIEAGVGVPAEDMVGNLMTIESSVAAPVFRTAEAVLVDDYPTKGAAAEAVRATIGSVIVAPLRDKGEVTGALAVGRLVDRAVFDRAELVQLDDFAHQVGVALELDRARHDSALANVYSDRERIAADMHDHVVQELFAAGLGLQALGSSVMSADLRLRIQAQIDALDDVVRRIRATIYDVRVEPRVADRSLRKRLLGIVHSLKPALGPLPTVAFVGPIDSAVGPGLGLDIEAVVREALTNVARHAEASVVRASISVDHRQAVVEVVDNGRGIDTATSASGLQNLARRAKRYGGTLEVSTPEGGGTCLVWTVPLTADEAKAASASRAEPGTTERCRLS